MFIKIHKSYRLVVAISDEDLIGKKFEDEKRQIFLRENFYKGEQISKKELINAIERYAREDATFNIVGKESIETAIEAGLIEKESTISIQGIPISLVL